VTTGETGIPDEQEVLDEVIGRLYREHDEQEFRDRVMGRLKRALYG